MPSFRVFLSHSIIFIIQNKKYKHIDDGERESKKVEIVSFNIFDDVQEEIKTRNPKKGGRSEKFQVN
jgi:hypothetical protein